MTYASAVMCHECASAHAGPPDEQLVLPLTMPAAAFAFAPSQAPEECCLCDAPADVLDVAYRLRWCTDCWVQEQCLRDVLAEAVRQHATADH